MYCCILGIAAVDCDAAVHHYDSKDCLALNRVQTPEAVTLLYMYVISTACCASATAMKNIADAAVAALPYLIGGPLA